VKSKIAKRSGNNDQSLFLTFEASKKYIFPSAYNNFGNTRCKESTKIAEYDLLPQKKFREAAHCVMLQMAISGRCQ
jgi:hypothetical protein